MTGHVLHHRRIFRDGCNFGQVLEAGTGRLESVKLLTAVANPTADDLLESIELEALELGFEKCIFWVRCDGASDEIQIAGKPKWEAKSSAEISSDEPWRSARGSELFGCSFLVRGNNYRDRVQLTFGPVDSSFTIQLEFAASKLRIYRVVPVGAA